MNVALGEYYHLAGQKVDIHLVSRLSKVTKFVEMTKTIQLAIYYLVIMSAHQDNITNLDLREQLG